MEHATFNCIKHARRTKPVFWTCFWGVLVSCEQPVQAGIFMMMLMCFGGAGGHSSGTSAAQTQDGAGLMHPSILPEEERPSARDCSDSLSQQNQSTRDVDKKLASERDSLCLDTVGPDARAAAASQPSADPQEWDLYVKYINHQVIQGHGDRIAADPGSQDTQPVLLSAKPKSTVHAQRFEKRQGKRIQAELEAQLAQVEAAAGTLSDLDVCALGSQF